MGVGLKGQMSSGLPIALREWAEAMTPVLKRIASVTGRWLRILARWAGMLAQWAGMLARWAAKLCAPYVRAACAGRWRVTWKWGLGCLAYDAAFWSAVFAMVALMATGGPLPDISAVYDYPGSRAIKVLASDGSVIARFGDVHGKPATAKSVPDTLRRAVLAMEDHRFYEHSGVDFWAIARAFWVNLESGRIEQGGSTITQQLAKNVFLSHDRTLRRKIRESLIAMRLEAAFSKDEILALYLNHVFLGARAYGVDAASRRYFGKPHTALSLYEAALLAGLLRAPSQYNPVRDRSLALRQARLVLSRMETFGLATHDEVQAALDRGVTFTDAYPGDFGHGYFVDWVLRQLPRFQWLNGKDLVIKTTLDPRLQRLAEATVENQLADNGRSATVGQAALVAMTKDGAIRAMVGGRSYRNSEFNRATQARRQPGSLFKLVDYLAAFEAGMTPDTVMLDAPISIGHWSPKNFKDRYYGRVSLRRAFAHSLNSVAVRLGQRIGFDRVAEMAKRLGLVTAYAVVANGGRAVRPRVIDEVRDFDGELLYRNPAAPPVRLLNHETVGKIMDLLRTTVESGTGHAAQLGGHFVAGKTGTSQNYRDAWFVGFTPELVTGVWMGNDYGAPMDDVTGGRLPARLWHGFMADALEGAPIAALPLAYADATSAENLSADYLASEYLAYDPSRYGAWRDGAGYSEEEPYWSAVPTRTMRDNLARPRSNAAADITWNSEPVAAPSVGAGRGYAQQVSAAGSGPTARAGTTQVVNSYERDFAPKKVNPLVPANVRIRRARQNRTFDRGR
jgi:penicillin-binding protein 1A